jgi:hypothetical protein
MEHIVSGVWKRINITKIVILDQMLSDKQKCSKEPAWHCDRQWSRSRYTLQVQVVALAAEWEMQ